MILFCVIAFLNALLLEASACRSSVPWTFSIACFCFYFRYFFSTVALALQILLRVSIVFLPLRLLSLYFLLDFPNFFQYFFQYFFHNFFLLFRYFFRF